MNSTLLGFWSGYDAVLRRPQSGRYKFRHRRNVKIVRLHSTHAGAALALLADCLGAASPPRA